MDLRSFFLLILLTHRKGNVFTTPFPPIHTGHTVEPTLKPNDITDPGHEWALQSRGWVTVEPGRKKQTCSAEQQKKKIFGCVSPIKCDSVWTLMTEGRQLCLLKSTLQSQYSLAPVNQLHLENGKAVAELLSFPCLHRLGKFCTGARTNLLLYLGAK